MSTLKRAADVVLEGRGKLMLRPSDYVTTGGEGEIYRVKNTIIKLYTDTKKMRHDDMAGKIGLLKEIKSPFIIAPEGLVTTSDGKPIGFYMPFVSGEPFPRLFTNDFRNREGFTDRDALALTAHMQEALRCAHDHKAIMADANEMNWIADIGRGKEPEPRAIDVDSWVIGRWPATVIMPSIRDWHTKGFNEMTDWFAWGVVSFEVFTGIHPYKGNLDGFKMHDIEGRMKANASVFRKGVRLNRAVRDFSSIPSPLRSWYEETFERGVRVVPPSPLQTGVVATSVARIARMVTTASGSLVYDLLLKETNDRAVRIFSCGVVLLASGRLINLENKREISKLKPLSCEVVRVENGWLIADFQNGKLSFSYVNAASLIEVPLSLSVTSRGLVRYENRLFVITDSGLTEVMLRIFEKPIVSLGNTWGALVNATRWFDGVGIQDAMGATYFIAPFDEKSCAQVRIRELDGLRPVEAKAGHRFIVVIAIDTRGDYHTFEFFFDHSYATYTVRKSATDTPELNSAILPKGVCATITEDGELVIFVPSSGTVNKVSDKDITTDMMLARWENKVLYIRDGEVWWVRMK